MQHYPKLKKYISLFPPEARKGEHASTASAEDADNTAQAREEVRSWVQSCMEKGELPGEPEFHQGSSLKQKPKLKDWDGNGESKKHTKSKTKSQPAQETPINGVEDDFFGEDDEDEDS